MKQTIDKEAILKEYTYSFMQSNRGCYSREKMEETVLKGRKLINYEDFLDCDIPIKDKYWFVCIKLATKEQNQQIAIGVSEIVVDIYEKRYPNCKAPREAIQGAKDYIAGTISISVLKDKRDAAAYAAYAAANSVANAAAAYAAAAYAAACAAAACAANAAVAYASDAANSVAAAAAAAYAADAAYAAYKEKLLSNLKSFIENN